MIRRQWRASSDLFAVNNLFVREGLFRRLVLLLTLAGLIFRPFAIGFFSTRAQITESCQGNNV
jgi:hypothetical protein